MYISFVQLQNIILGAIVLLLIIFPQQIFGYTQSSYYGQFYYQSGYYSQSYYQGSYGTTLQGAVLITGDADITGTISKGTGTFVIDHPLRPRTHLLFHSFVESPDVKNIYDGVTTLNSIGEAEITLPSYFEALNTDYRYLFFPHGEAMPNLYVKQEVGGNHFTIAGGNPGGTVSWQVTGIRKDPYILANPIITEVNKGPDALVEKGEFLHPEVYGR